MVIAGPTASGKSALALAVAEAFDGIVVNADSMQVYRDLKVLTARPGKDETGRVPHCLYGVIDGAQRCSVARWLRLAVREVEKITDDGRLPVFAGGTGLYIDALINGLSAIPDIDPEILDAATRSYDAQGGPAFHAALMADDPETAARLEPGDRQRLLRARSVLDGTGRGLSDWHAEGRTPPTGLDFHVVQLSPPRDQLYRRCDARVEAMIDAGALDEVAKLCARGLDPDLPVMKAIGVPEFAAYLAGATPLEDAIAAVQQATRRYAKRQMTWLRNQIISNQVVEVLFSESLIDEIFIKIRAWGLTPRGDGDIDPLDAHSGSSQLHNSTHNSGQD